jgi:hypothetical protein
MPFDIAGNGFRVAVWFLGLAVIVEAIRVETLDSHMWPPDVVPVFEFDTQESQVVKALDDRSATAMAPCFPTAPKRGLMFHCRSSSAIASPTKILA